MCLTDNGESRSSVHVFLPNLHSFIPFLSICYEPGTVLRAEETDKRDPRGPCLLRAYVPVGETDTNRNRVQGRTGDGRCRGHRNPHLESSVMASLGEAFLLSLKDENGLTRSEPPKYGARRSGSSSLF